MENPMSRINLEEHRFMVSPCGYYADIFHVSKIADEVAGWTDCTNMSDADVNGLMMRRMRAHQLAAEVMA
jgi:hypothetical protein